MGKIGRVDYKSIDLVLQTEMTVKRGMTFKEWLTQETKISIEKSGYFFDIRGKSFTDLIGGVCEFYCLDSNNSLDRSLVRNILWSCPNVFVLRANTPVIDQDGRVYRQAGYTVESDPDRVLAGIEFLTGQTDLMDPQKRKAKEILTSTLSAHEANIIYSSLTSINKRLKDDGVPLSNLITLKKRNAITSKTINNNGRLLPQRPAGQEPF